ncbi:MAG: hypothetical protein SCJ93_03970 [Bacillota bacterium]|nr:hypothetical protein [Bacillota bacterium]
MKKKIMVSLIISILLVPLVMGSFAIAEEHNDIDVANESAYLMRLIKEAEVTGNQGLKEWALEQGKKYGIYLGINGRKISVEASGEGIWIMPGKRDLDPHIFGTPQEPNHINILPVDQRMVSEDGESFTTTKMPGPFSNNVVEIDNGYFDLYVEDNTILDNPNSNDKATLEAVFYGPNGENEYKVVVNKILPVGPEHTFFGGVGTDVYIHGDTNIGEPLLPKLWNYTAVWGIGDLYINDEMVDNSRLVHLMVGQRVRNENYELGFDVAMPDELEIHIVLPPTKIVDGMPTDSPVPTGVMLPNDQQQPFIHVNYYENINITGNRFLE